MNSNVKIVLVEKKQRPILFGGHNLDEKEEYNLEDAIVIISKLININREKGGNIVYVSNYALTKEVISVLIKNGVTMTENSIGDGKYIHISKFNTDCRTKGCVYNVYGNCKCNGIGTECKSYS